jgi:hypothetical protein
MSSYDELRELRLARGPGVNTLATRGDAERRVLRLARGPGVNTLLRRALA